ncbi:hypothetical protein Ais01nite_75410 [Asanoa ishikariensis]|nr:hypothetical protein Ais01nite_75410 [Asanoa ishikariensis]
MVWPGSACAAATEIEQKGRCSEPSAPSSQLLATKIVSAGSAAEALPIGRPVASNKPAASSVALRLIRIVLSPF